MLQICKKNHQEENFRNICSDGDFLIISDVIQEAGINLNSGWFLSSIDPFSKFEMSDLSL